MCARQSARSWIDDGFYTVAGTRVASHRNTKEPTMSLDSATEFSNEPETTPTIDKRLIGERNRLRLLENLSRFSWLTSRMLSVLLWADGSQPLPMARRLLKSMLDDKLILRRELPSGPDCYTLSAAGARFLTKATGAAAHSGASLPLGNFVHRACSNWYVIHHINAGNRVWTEHEIQTGCSPVRMVDGKVPDFLVELPDHGGLLWGECEHAWKSKAERAKICRLCIRHLPRDTQLSLLSTEQYLLRVVIVGTTQNALDAVVRSFKQLHHSNELTDGQAGDVDLVLLPVDKSLNAGAMKVTNLYWDGLNTL
jgi:hypothetical protein